MSNIFDIPVILETLDNEIAAGQDPDPAIVAWLVNEGPKAVEKWIDCIEQAEAEAALLATRIAELQGRKAARVQTVGRMKDVLIEILDKSFQGKIKTAEVTAWTQEVKTVEFEGEIPSVYKIPQPDKVDKKAMLTDLKAGTLAPEIIVIETSKPTLRIRR